MRRALITSAIGYALGSFVLALYGTIVCPLMSSLGAPLIAGVVALGGAAALGIELADRKLRPNIEPTARWTLQWYVWLTPAIAIAVAESIAVLSGSATAAPMNIVESTT